MGNFQNILVEAPFRARIRSVVIWVLMVGHRGREREREREKERQQKYRRFTHS